MHVTNFCMHTHAIQDGCVSITLCFPASMTVLFLIQACCWVLGEKSYSPPGTRKTESVKALGNLFGWKVLVFNCDEVSTSWRGLVYIVSCRAEVPCYQIVQSHVVFTYVISQSDVGLDDLYCSNIKHHYLYCLWVLKFHSPFGYVFVSSSSPTMSSTVWRRPCCLWCPYRFSPSKTPSGPVCPPQNCQGMEVNWR